MNSLARHSVRLGAAVALTIGLTAAAVFLVHAHSGLQPAPHICAAGLDVTEESPFLVENGAAMTKMMNEMTVRPTGDVDTDFVAMMVPHHQGAIENG